jgi:hypothetical protein
MKFVDTTPEHSDLWGCSPKTFLMQVKAGSCLQSFELDLQPAGGTVYRFVGDCKFIFQ